MNVPRSARDRFQWVTSILRPQKSIWSQKWVFVSWRRYTLAWDRNVFEVRGRNTRDQRPQGGNWYVTPTLNTTPAFSHEWRPFKATENAVKPDSKPNYERLRDKTEMFRCCWRFCFCWRFDVLKTGIRQTSAKVRSRPQKWSENKIKHVKKWLFITNNGSKKEKFCI